MKPTHMDKDGNICFPEGVPGATALPPNFWVVFDLETAKASYFAQVKALRKKAETGGVDTPFGRIETTSDSLERINQAVLAAMVKGKDFSKIWRRADNTDAKLTAADMLAIGVIIDTHFEACLRRKKELDLQIAEAASNEALIALNINSNWP